MRMIQLALLTAILLAVMSVAFELHQLNRAFAIPAMISDELIDGARARETRAHRNERLQRQTKESIEDGKAILKTPTARK